MNKTEYRTQNTEYRHKFVLCALCSVLCALVLIGCFVPPKMTREGESIFVSIFKNKTREYGLEEELSSAIIEEVMKGGVFKIESKERADYSLYGEILDYKKAPIAWTSDKEITEYRLTLRVVFELKRGDTIILKEEAIEAIVYSKDEEYYKKMLLKRISRSIVNRLYK